MKTVRTLAVFFAVGLMFGGAGTAFGQGIPTGDDRECVRRLCAQLRNCAGGERPVGVEKPVSTKDAVSKKAESSPDAQGRPEMSCREYAAEEYMYCSQGEDIKVRETPSDEKDTKLVEPSVAK